MKNMIFLFTFLLCSCISLPEIKYVCKTDVKIVRASYLLDRHIPDKPFKIAYYPTTRLHNLGHQCEDYISAINEIGDYFFKKFHGKSIKEMEIALNKEQHLNKFNYMLPGNGKPELKVGQKIQIQVYEYKEMETIFSSTFFSTKIRISNIY
ncbi:hypothetical protein ACWIW6_00310 [Ursidibacter sp. B-7004-1]